MKKDEETEIEKCRNNPYYFATNYLYITDKNGDKHLFQTPLSEKQFNEYFKIKNENN